MIAGIPQRNRRTVRVYTYYRT